MGYHLDADEPVGEAVKRVIREQVRRALEEIDGAAAGPHETVHAVRKRCKKVRAVLRVVRPSFPHVYRAENARYRDAARMLSDIRDAQSQIACYDKLMEVFEDQVERRQFGPVRGALTRRRNQLAEIELRLVTFRDVMETGLESVDAWQLEGDGFALLAGGLKKTYRRGRRALKAAYRHPTPENFHEWRKRAKYHWYHLRLVRNVWRPVLARRRDEVHRLANFLGDDHDLAVLRRTLLEQADEFADRRDVQAMVGLIDRRRRELQASARPLGNRVFGEKPGRLLDRLEAYWKAWQAETKCVPVLADAPPAAGR